MRKKILDFLVHGGHQAEFFKLPHHFDCTLPDGNCPDKSAFGRALGTNVTLSKYADCAKEYDYIICRAGVPEHFIIDHVRKGSIPIALMQTTNLRKIPDYINIVVWNSRDVYSKYKKDFSSKKNYYIQHGFDPTEFNYLNLKRNERVLSSYSLFKQRGDLLGFNNWLMAASAIGRCDVLGHGNEELPGAIGSVGQPDLTITYNTYSIYLNTAIESAMPRARGEAMMAGLPIITTDTYDARYYFNNKNSIIANNSDEQIKAIKLLLSSKNLADELSAAGRDTAIKYFHIEDYLKKWNTIIS